MAAPIYQFGRHRVRNGDVNDGIADLMGPDRADIMYSDPPWGEGNIKYWATMNKKMTGNTNVPVPLDTFLNSIFTIAQTYVSRYLLIEYGQQWADMILKRGQAAGFSRVALVKLLYRGGAKLLPLDLHVFTRGAQPLPENYFQPIAGTHGYKTVQLAVGPLAAMVKAQNPNAIILDPCCGMGYTAQSAVDYGLAFRGNELNSKRLQKTINRISGSH